MIRKTTLSCEPDCRFDPYFGLKGLALYVNMNRLIMVETIE